MKLLELSTLYASLDKLMGLELPYSQRRAIRKTVSPLLDEIKEYEAKRNEKIKELSLIDPNDPTRLSPISDTNREAYATLDSWIGEALSVDIPIINPTDFTFDETNAPSNLDSKMDALLIKLTLLKD